MIKALWFFIKAAVVAGVILWVAERPGTVRIEWMDYVFTLQMGLFLAALVVVVLLSIFIYRVIKTFVDFPASLRHYNRVKGREKGYRALTLGLTAVAAGDTQAAMREAKKAKTLLPEGDGLPLLLDAQAARLDGREEDAQARFVELLENKDAAFLGVRGLLQSSMDRGDHDEALNLAQKALILYPKQPWILRIVYDLALRLRRWHEAEDVLKRCVRVGAVSKERAKSDRCAMALALAIEAEDEGLHDVAERQYAKAKRLDASFAPVSILHAGYLMRRGQAKKARHLIERAWKKTPHAALVDLWLALMPEDKDADALSRLKWIERLVSINADNAALQISAGEAAMASGLWGEARSHFAKAEDIQPSVRLYKALARLEEMSSGNKEGAQQWLEKAAEAPADKAWICRESGRVYDHWDPIAEPHGSFNTIEWSVPGEGAHRGPVLRLSSDADPSLIEAPQAVSS